MIRRIILCVIFLSFAKSGMTSDLTLNDIIKNMENVATSINDITFTARITSRNQDPNIKDYRIILESQSWFKKPNLGKQESHFKSSPHKIKSYIYNSDANFLYVHEILKEKKINTKRYPLSTLKLIDVHPEKFIHTLKKLEKNNTPHTIEHKVDEGAYMITFSLAQPWKYYIKDDTWLFHKRVMNKDDQIMEYLWENTKINEDIQDTLFQLPSSDNNHLNKKEEMTTPTNIELTRCGIFQNITEKEYLSTDKLLITENLIVTDQVPAEKNTIFGCIFIVHGKPTGANATEQIWVGVLHPDIKDPNTGKIKNETTLLTTEMTLNREESATFMFWSADEHTIVPGKWTFQFYGGAEKMAEKTFTVL